MTTTQPTPLITAQVSRLFRRDDVWDVPACLPFVSGDNSWDVPAEPEGDARNDVEIGLALDRGKRYAAAYFIYLARNGDSDLSLYEISAAMASSNSSATQQSFWRYISRLLWIYGHDVSAVQIAADVEIVIAEENQLHLADLRWLEAK